MNSNEFLCFFKAVTALEVLPVARNSCFYGVYLFLSPTVMGPKIIAILSVQSVRTWRDNKYNTLISGKRGVVCLSLKETYFFGQVTAIK